MSVSVSPEIFPETMTQLVEKRFQNFDLAGAYAASTLLAALALLTLGAMTLLNRRKDSTP